MLNIFCDGGSRGNPGPAASAFVAKDLSGTIIYQQGFYLGQTTNNQAEYQAVVEALKWLPDSSEVNFYLDSELVVKQINGFYKVKDQNLKIKYLEVKKLLTERNLKVEKFNYIPREQNKSADLLVNKILDQNL